MKSATQSLQNRNPVIQSEKKYGKSLLLKGTSGRKKSLAQMKEREKCKKRAITDLNTPNGSRDIPFQS